MERVGVETIRGITFAVDKGDAGFVGHSWVVDEVSGLVFGVVESGVDLPSLRAAIVASLDDVFEYARSESGKAPKLVGGGHDPHNPPNGSDT